QAASHGDGILLHICCIVGASMETRPNDATAVRIVITPPAGSPQFVVRPGRLLLGIRTRVLRDAQVGSRPGIPFSTALPRRSHGRLREQSEGRRAFRLSEATTPQIAVPRARGGERSGRSVPVNARSVHEPPSSGLQRSTRGYL